MKTETLRKTKVFWAWQDEQEEAWLSQMALEGWHLKSLPGPLRYEFEAGAPRRDIYRMDFISDRKEYQSYLQLFRDSGWQHLGEMGGWQYFRKTAQGDQTPEIYTDNASKASKYQRLLGFLVIFLPILIFLFTQPVRTDSPLAWLHLVAKILGVFLLVIYGVAIVKILQRVRRLQG